MAWELPKPLYDNYSWQDRALCRRQDVESFFSEDAVARSERQRRERAAKRTCGRCPVRGDCLEHALGSEAHGVWGGLTAAERATLRRERALALRTA